MKGDITVHDIESLPDGVSTLQVIGIEDTLAGQEYFVRLASGEDYEDTPFEDYPQAYAHWRNVLRQLGINVPYNPPVVVQFIDEAGQPVTPARAWIDVYYEMHGRLKLHYAGSPAATAVRDEFMARPEFVEHAVDILHSCDGKQDWIHAIIRTACRRVMAKEKVEAAKVVQEQLGSLPTFGAF